MGTPYSPNYRNHKKAMNFQKIKSNLNKRLADTESFYHTNQEKIIFFACIIIIILIGMLNTPPQSTIVASGDFFSSFNIFDRWNNYSFAWTYGVGQGGYNTLYLTQYYYIIFGFLERYITSDQIAVVKIIFILLGSFLSSYFSSKAILSKHKLPHFFAILIALIYSFNPLTQTFISYSWGYTHHVLIYIFIPILVSLLIYLLEKPTSLNVNNITLWIFVNSVIVLNINNIAFIFSIILLEGIYILGYIINKFDKTSIWSLIKRIFFILFPQILIWIPSIIFYYIANSYAVSTSKTSLALGDTSAWIRNTSIPIFDVISLNPNGYNSLNIFVNYIYILIPVFLLAFLIYYKKDFKKIAIPTITYLILTFLSARYYGYFENINHFFYESSIGTFFRSSDKIFFLLPVVYCLFVAYFIKTYYKIQIVRNTLTILLLLTNIIGVGVFLFKAPMNKLLEPAKDYSRAVSIPEEYKNFASIVNNDINAKDNGYTVISLPYNVINSPNWSNYPKWGFVGQDILKELFEIPYINSNTTDHPLLEKIFSFKDLQDEKNISIEDLVRNVQSFSGKYLIIHKDVDPWYLDYSSTYINVLKTEKGSLYFDKMESTNYFDIYVLKDAYLKPILSSKTDTNLDFVIRNVTNYGMTFTANPYEHLELEFNQTYSPQWKMSCNIPPTLIIHKLGNTYNNKWEMSFDNQQETDISCKINYSLDYYLPFYYNAILFLIFSTLVLMLTFYYKNKTK